MIYSNDEADKSIRRKNYYVQVYVLPLILFAALTGGIYLLFSKYHHRYNDLISLITLPLTPALLLGGYYRKQWLKMPDGTYHNIKGISPNRGYAAAEPLEYDDEFYTSTRSKLSVLLIGAAILGFSVFLLIKSKGNLITGLAPGILGLFFLGWGIKNLLDKSPKLKLSKKGLWTEKLGFVEWKQINKTTVVDNRKGENPSLTLEIYLKGTIFSEAGQPDERLNITNLNNANFIETILVNISRPESSGLAQ